LNFKIITIPFDSSRKSFFEEELNKFCMDKKVNRYKTEFFSENGCTFWTVFIEYEPIISEPETRKDDENIEKKGNPVEAWTRQWGTDKSAVGYSVAVDSSGNVFVTGYTDGDIDGNTNSGVEDIFLTKFDNDGEKLWTKQWGTDKHDDSTSVAVDSNDNIYVTGYTYGDLEGNTSVGRGLD